MKLRSCQMFAFRLVRTPTIVQRASFSPVTMSSTDLIGCEELSSRRQRESVSRRHTVLHTVLSTISTYRHESATSPRMKPAAFSTWCSEP